jgi:D-alanyl-D-alanine carboxypeptidase
MMLREVGRMCQGEGSLEAGVAEWKQFLAEMDIEPRALDLEDGSGLTRATLIPPRAITALLLRMHRSISHVNSLSGYAGLNPQHRVAFAIMANNHASPASEIRAVIDKLGAAILQYGVE